MTTLPPKMTIRGTALVSATLAEGHGFHLTTEGVLDLVNHPSVHLVADHSASISAVAGTASLIGSRTWKRTSKRRPKAASYAADSPLTEDFEEIVAALDFSAVAQPPHQGYPLVANHIIAMRADGRVPNVSVRIKATDLDYDPQTDRVYYLHPYKLHHIGVVDVAAIKPHEGVGIWSADFSSHPTPSVYGQSLQFGVDDTPNTPLHLSVEVDNGLELVASFAEKNLNRPDLLARVGKLLGLDSDPKPTPTAALSEPDSPSSNTATDGVPSEGTNIPSNVTDMSAPTAPATTPAPQGQPAAPNQPAESAELAVLRAEYQREIAAARQVRVDAEAAELASLRSALKSDFKVSDETLAAFTSKPQLVALRAGFEAQLANGNPLPKPGTTQPQRPNTPDPAAAALAEGERVRKAWIAEMSAMGRKGGTPDQTLSIATQKVN